MQESHLTVFLTKNFGEITKNIYIFAPIKEIILRERKIKIHITEIFIKKTVKKLMNLSEIREKILLKTIFIFQ